MNNSKFAIESLSLSEEIPQDRTLWFRQREEELVSIIEAINGVEKTSEWSSLKRLVFDGILGTLKREREKESSKKNPDVQELARLNGQIAWSEKYADLSKLRDVFRQELIGIRKQYDKNPGDGAPRSS